MDRGSRKPGVQLLSPRGPAGIHRIRSLYIPREIAYFIPLNPEKRCFDVKMANKPLGTAEDLVVDVDDCGIYLNTMHDGAYILRMKDGI